MVRQKHHYFASCVFGWATADTRTEAVEKLVNMFRPTIKPLVSKAHKAGDAGFYIWCCCVALPSDSSYEINFYAPQDVPTDDGREHFVTYLTAKAMAFTGKTPA